MIDTLPQNYWDLEDQLEAKIGKTKLALALSQLEEEYGLNGVDLYHAGEFDLLLDIVNEMQLKVPPRTSTINAVMTNEQINIAIFEIFGWKWEPEKNSFCKDINGEPLPFLEKTPDYCNNLNFVHEIEKTLNIDQQYNYGEALRIASENVGSRGGHFPFNGWGCFALANLNARKRCEALLKVIGKLPKDDATIKKTVGRVR